MLLMFVLTNKTHANDHQIRLRVKIQLLRLYELIIPSTYTLLPIITFKYTFLRTRIYFLIKKQQHTLATN